MSMDKSELERFIETVIDKIPHDDGYPSDIIDRIFYEIEQSPIFMGRYNRLVRNTKKGKHTINPWIGKLVKQYTEMGNDKEKVPAQLSSLIETYTELK
jgi:hypothetical protein